MRRSVEYLEIAHLILHLIGCDRVQNEEQTPCDLIGWMAYRNEDSSIMAPAVHVVLV